MLEHTPQFSTAPTSFQFAKGGMWEKAWSFPTDLIPSNADISSYLAQSDEVAFEAFFDRSFFGARMVGSALDVEKFCLKCLRAATSKESFFATFYCELGCPISDRKPIFSEIGCINAWHSVGTTRHPDIQLAFMDFEKLYDLLNRCAVGSDINHQKAIELAFEHPISHWFGIPISAPGKPNTISAPLLRKAIRIISQYADK